MDPRILLLRHWLITIIGYPVLAARRIHFLWLRLRSAESTTVHRGSFQPTGLWCICALHQPRSLSNNVVAYLTALRAAGYNIIAVNNGQGAPGLRNALLPLCHTVMLRSPGTGRDFGSYKAATSYLRSTEPREGVRQVIYCNDSVFVMPDALSRFLSSLSKMSDQYIGVVESFPFHHHVASWFFAVSGGVFRSDYFQAFWEGFIPVSHRHYVIEKGEVALTRCLIANGVYPHILFTADHVLKVLFAGDRATLLESVCDLVPMSLYDKLLRARIVSAFLRPAEVSRAASGMLISLLEGWMLKASSVEGGMELLQMVLLKHCAFPFIKKDCVYRNRYHCIQLQRALDGATEGDALHLDEILGYLRLRGSRRWQSPVRKLRVATGLQD